MKPEDGLAKSGPSEAVMTPTSTPAAAAYPPCRRGAGDDHCIQLYEPGVRAQLAGWNRSASGSDSAMGGPYEPVDTTLAGELGGTDTAGRHERRSASSIGPPARPGRGRRIDLGFRLFGRRLRFDGASAPAAREPFA